MQDYRQAKPKQKTTKREEKDKKKKKSASACISEIAAAVEHKQKTKTKKKKKEPEHKERAFSNHNKRLMKRKEIGKEQTRFSMKVEKSKMRSYSRSDTLMGSTGQLASLFRAAARSARCFSTKRR